MTLGERFWSKVNKNGRIVRAELGPCWEWTGCGGPGHPRGYGYMWSAERRGTVTAHRVSWELHFGPIPGGSATLVCHRCDVRHCVNPDHLFLGSYADNNADTASKGRAGPRTTMPGETNGNAKLTEDVVRLIRERYAAVGNYLRVGNEFGISHATVAQIAKRKTWRHVA